MKKKEIIEELQLIKNKLLQLYINRNVDFDINLIKELNEKANHLINLHSNAIKSLSFIKKDDDTPSLVDRIKDKIEDIKKEPVAEVKTERPKRLLERITDRIDNMEVHHYQKNEDPQSLVERIKDRIEDIKKEPHIDNIQKKSDDPKPLFNRIMDKIENRQSHNNAIPPVNINTFADANSNIEVKLASAIIEEKRNNDFSKLASYHKYYYIKTMIDNIDNVVNEMGQ